MSNPSETDSTIDATTLFQRIQMLEEQIDKDEGHVVDSNETIRLGGANNSPQNMLPSKSSMDDSDPGTSLLQRRRMKNELSVCVLASPGLADGAEYFDPDL